MADYFLSPKAQEDLDEIARYIARDNLEAALRLYDRARDTFELLLRSPMMGSSYPSLHPDLKSLRFFPIKDYSKYLIFYVSKDSDIIIIRVLHGARNVRHLIGV